MDCFFAQVELKENPELRGHPVAVGGDPNKRGVIAAADYVARQFGVRSAMSSAKAVRLCPQLKILKPSFEKYKKESQKIRQVFERYTEKIEPLSLDEAFLDVSESSECQGSATLLAKQIRDEIFEKTGLTASAGIAPNKFLAKIASDWKKPNGQFTIGPKDVADFIVELPVEKIFGVGKVTAQKMHKLGIYTCKDLQGFEKVELIRLFGKWGHQLYGLCRGEDHRSVKSERDRKSFSVERTFHNDVAEEEELKEVLLKVYNEFQRRWEKAEIPTLRIKGTVVKVKFADFKQTTHETRKEKCPEFEEIYQLFSEARKKDPEKPIRLIGVGVKLYSNKEYESRASQTTLF